MKKGIILAMGIAAILLTSCGASRKAENGGDYNPKKESSAVKRVRRTVDPTYKLAREEGENLRAASSAISTLEDVALENAENAAVSLLAGRIESAIIGVRERFNKTNQVGNRTLTSQQVQNYMKTLVAQKLSYKVIGEPSIYDNDDQDRTITAYICIELTTSTKEILGDAYDKMVKDGVLQTEIDKNQFVKENEEELKKLREKVGL